MKFVELGEVAEVISGQSPKGIFYNKEGKGLPFYQGKKDFGSRYIREPVVWTTQITRTAKAEDILMSVRAPVGPINLATQEICIGRGLAAIRVGPEISNDYLFYFLEFMQPTISGTSGAVFDSINKEQISSIQIPLPPILKQKHIVENLDKAFAEIDSLEKNLQLKEEKTIQLLQSMFNTALNNDKFEKKVVTLDQISENLDNQRIPITREVRTVGKYPYYGASGIIDYVEDYIFEGDALLVSEDGANLLARSTPIAFSVTGKYWVNNHAHILRFKDQYLQEYVRHFLENTNLDKFITGAAQPKLTQRALNNIPIEIPLNQLDVKSVSEGLSKLKELTFLIMENFVRKRKLTDELKSAFLSKYFGQQDA
jgi:type I restriction enzyme S subunit